MILNLIKLWGYINIIFYAVVGFLACVKTDMVAKHLNFTFVNHSGVCEFKATYGGAMLAFSIFLCFLMYRQQWQELTVFLAIMYFGYGCGRLLAMFGENNSLQTISYLAVELIGGVFAVILYLLQYRH